MDKLEWLLTLVVVVLERPLMHVIEGEDEERQVIFRPDGGRGRNARLKPNGRTAVDKGTWAWRLA